MDDTKNKSGVEAHHDLKNTRFIATRTSHRQPADHYMNTEEHNKKSKRIHEVLIFDYDDISDDFSDNLFLPVKGIIIRFFEESKEYRGSNYLHCLN